MSTTANTLPRSPLVRTPARLLSDDRLARLVVAGDPHAFAALYRRHHQVIFRYCLTIVRHEQDAQDVLQSTMANALAALSRGLPDAPMRPWLFRIAHNEAVSALRRHRPAVELDENSLTAADGLEARVEDRRRLALLVADLQDLPERQRGALVMRELSGLSHEEIGAAFQTSAARAKQAILDARMSLREFDTGRAMRCGEVQHVISAQDGRQLRARPIRAHLRGCSDCRNLRDAIQARHRDFALLAPPLSPMLAAGLLAKFFGDGGGSGGGAVAAGKAAGATLMGKTIAGAAAVATVGAGVGVGVHELRVPVRQDGAAASRAPTAPRAHPAAGTAPATKPSVKVVLADPAVDRRRARRAARRAAPARSFASGERPKPSADGSPATPVTAPGHLEREQKRGSGPPGGGRARAKPITPDKPAKPDKPASPVKPFKPATPVSPSEPAKPVKPERPRPTPPGQAPTPAPSAGAGPK